MAKRRSRTSGAQRAFQIIECLVELGRPATAYQVAKMLGAPLSTVYESIGLLERLDILMRAEGEGKVSLGPRLYFYGLSYLRGLDVDYIYRREAAALSHATGENVQINLRDGDSLVVTTVIEGPDPYHFSTRVGSRVPLSWTASGRLFLGAMEPGERAAFIARLTETPAGRPAAGPEQLDRESREAWAAGYSIQAAATDFSVTCIAAPIVDPEKGPVAAVCLMLPESRARKREKELAEMTMQAARNIERGLGLRDQAPMPGPAASRLNLLEEEQDE